MNDVADTVEKTVHHKKRPQPQLLPYKKLKQTKKARISNIMFEAVCKYYKKHEHMPPEEELESICRSLYPRLHGIAQKVAFEEFFTVFCKKQARFAEHIEKNGIPEPPKPKVKKTEAEKLAMKRARRKAKKKKLEQQQDSFHIDQDDRFFFIVGYTSGGAPYGVTWEEMGLEPWESTENLEAQNDTEQLT